MNPVSECVTGGVAACGACLFTNPLEVVKTRMQLQGELQARGTYTIHYKNVFHAFHQIGKIDGILALQKGLGPGLAFQFVMNGLRLGSYQVFTNMHFTRDSHGDLSFIKCLLAGAISGCIGAFTASPAYLLKTQLQAQANAGIAVGTQHNISNVFTAVREIFLQHGMKGLWRGGSAIITRVSVGSAVQLTSFSKSKEIILEYNLFMKESILVPFSASMLAGLFVVVAMTPFDVVSTRLYNQGVSSRGKGLLYTNVFDVFRKMFISEGVIAFYKGTGAHYFRIGPHTTLSLVFWERLRKFLND